MDAMAEGASFSKAAQFVGVSKDQAKHRFNRLAARLGADVDLTASRGAAQ
jgi:hypothetical protein